MHNRRDALFLSGGALAYLGLGPTDGSAAVPSQPLYFAPQLGIRPRGGSERHIVHILTSLSCTDCYGFFGSVLVPLLKDESISGTTWVFTLIARNPGDVRLIKAFMQINRRSRLRALFAVMGAGYRNLPNYKKGNAQRILSRFPRDAPYDEGQVEIGIILANKYFSEQLDQNDTPGVYVDERRVPFNRSPYAKSEPENTAAILRMRLLG